MPIVAVFGSSAATADDPVYRDAIRLGRLLGEAGLTVANGGYAGVMEAVSEGARSSGGAVIGVTAPGVFPHRRGTNPHVTREIRAQSITERIHRLVDMADAAIALPGSLGTLAELVVAWNDGFVAPFRGARPKPHVVVGPIWRNLVAVIASEIDADPSAIQTVDHVEEAAAIVTRTLLEEDRPPMTG